MKSFVAMIFFPFLLNAQTSPFPKDTSYTIYSAYQKLCRDYPMIRIAEPEINERIIAGRDEMIEKIKSFNIHSEVCTIENTPHTFWLFHPWFEKTAEAAVKFLDKIFSR